MRIAGIICEYNPFHAGHAWMLQQTRAMGAEAIVCAMSGNFVQRGEAAMVDKFARAEMAVRCGADLVLELPTLWSAATAEVFARGGAEVLCRTGVVNTLAFGSECGDAAALRRAAAVLDTPEYHETLRSLLQSGESFAVCRRRAVAQLRGEETAALLDGANNNLGIEYIRALRRLDADLDILTVPRTGAGHDGAPVGGIASASHIRALLTAGRTEEALSYLPDAAAEILRRELAAGRAPASLAHCERAILAKLRQMGEEDFAPYDGGAEGLYRRFYKALRTTTSIESLLEEAKTKRYTHARLRRMLLASWLDLEEAPACVPYLRVLAANQTGRALLRQMRDNGAPVLTRPADVAALGSEAEALFTREAARTDLYALTYPDLRHSLCGQDWRATPLML